MVPCCFKPICGTVLGIWHSSRNNLTKLRRCCLHINMEASRANDVHVLGILEKYKTATSALGTTSPPPRRLFLGRLSLLSSYEKLWGSPSCGSRRLAGAQQGMRDPLKGHHKGWFAGVIPSFPAEHQQEGGLAFLLLHERKPSVRAPK